jgi:hypothetical protein
MFHLGRTTETEELTQLEQEANDEMQSSFPRRTVLLPVASSRVHDVTAEPLPTRISTEAAAVSRNQNVSAPNSNCITSDFTSSGRKRRYPVGCDTPTQRAQFNLNGTFQPKRAYTKRAEGATATATRDSMSQNRPAATVTPTKRSKKKKRIAVQYSDDSDAVAERRARQVTATVESGDDEIATDTDAAAADLAADIRQNVRQRTAGYVDDEAEDTGSNTSSGPPAKRTRSHNQMCTTYKDLGSRGASADEEGTDSNSTQSDSE